MKNDSLTIVPEKLTDHVMNFCSKVSPRQTPCYVPVLPETYCRMGYCFENVAAKIAKDGGSIEYGWQIWMWPGFFIEAEFHAVWKNPTGKYVDITPKDVAHPNILFVPDGKKKYNGYQIDNIRHNLSKNQLVDLFIDVTECLFSVQKFVKKPYENVVTLRGEDAELFKYLSFWRYTLQEMLKKIVSRNAQCPCGSGIKFKNCCCKELLKTIEILKKHR